MLLNVIVIYLGVKIVFWDQFRTMEYYMPAYIVYNLWL